MESQSHHTHGHRYDEPLLPTVIEGAQFHDEDEKKSVIKKVKETAKKIKETIKHGHGHGHHHNDTDECEETVYHDSPAVRSGLVEPTGSLGTPVLAEDLYATHYDISDPPVRPFSQWEEEDRQHEPPPLSSGLYGTTGLSRAGRPGYGEDVNMDQPRGNIGKYVEDEEREGVPPPLSTGVYGPGPARAGRFGYGEDVNMEQARGNIGKLMEDEDVEGAPPSLSTGVYGTGRGEDVNMEQLRGKIGKSTGMMVEDPGAPDPTKAVSPSNYQTKVTDPSHTGGKEATGITDVLRSFDKMAVYDEHESKPAPKPIQNPTGKISAATSAIASKATSAKDAIASKLGYPTEPKTDSIPGSNETAQKTASASDYAHKVAETMTGTLGPVYEKVVGVGSSVMSKMHGPGPEDKAGSAVSKAEVGENKGGRVKEYLTETFRPGDDDKELSEVITHAFHRGGKDREPEMKKPEQVTERVSVETSSYVVDEGGNVVAGERRLQESGN